MSELVLDKNNELPIGWVKTCLDEICDIILGQSPPSSTYNESGNGLPFFQGKADFGDLHPIPRIWCFQPQKIAESGDVLLSVRAPVGSTNLSNQQCCIGRGLSAIRPKIEEIPSKFFLYFFMNIRQDLDAKGTGTTFKAISGQQIRSLEILFPPLNEQKRIVAKIEELFSKIEFSKELLEKTKILLKQYRQSLLKSAFEGKLVPQDPNDEPASVLLQRIGLKKHGSDFHMSQLITEKNDLPNGWSLATFEDVSERVTVGYVSKITNQYTTKGIPFLRSKNIKENYLDLRGISYVTKEFHNSIIKSRLEPNDLVVVRSGSIGTACVIPDTLSEANCSDLSIIKNPGGIIAKFGCYYINSLGRTHVHLNQVGIALPHFNTKMLAKMIIPVPPLSEQKRIVAKIEEGFSLIQNSEKLVDSLILQNNSMKNSILKQAFEGKLVPQDPNDEPAEILLEKIKLEKQKTVNQSTKPRKKNGK